MEGQVRKGGRGRTDGWVEGQEALGAEGGESFGHGVDREDWTDGKWMGGWGGTQYKDILVYWSQLQFAKDLLPRLTATEVGSEGWLVGIPQLSPELHSVEKPPSHPWTGLSSALLPIPLYHLHPVLTGSCPVLNFCQGQSQEMGGNTAISLEPTVKVAGRVGRTPGMSFQHCGVAWCHRKLLSANRGGSPT